MSVRNVWQLQRIVLRYCVSGGSSTGARQYIQTGLFPFAAANPQIKIKTQHLGSRHPVVFGEYADGSTKEVDIKNKTPEEIGRVFSSLRDTATGMVRSLSKPVISKNPSIQGIWDPSMTMADFQMKST